MTEQCRCPSSDHNPPAIGTSLGSGLVGHWQALPGTQVEANSGNADRPLKRCECGCNVYQGTSPIGPTDADSLDIPALPVILDYVDDDDASDDHEYVSIKITDLAQMIKANQACTCQDH